MQVNSLQLALALFEQKHVRVINTTSNHAVNHHVYYRTEGKNRVLLVPKKMSPAEFTQLQQEVGILLSRNAEEQIRIGHLDGPQ